MALMATVQYPQPPSGYQSTPQESRQRIPQGYGGGYRPKPPQAPPQAPSSGGSPVNPNGRITTGSPSWFTQPATTQTTPPPTPPPTPDPHAPPGMVRSVGGGWVPPDHPDAAPAPPTGGPAGGPAPITAGTVPYGSVAQPGSPHLAPPPSYTVPDVGTMFDPSRFAHYAPHQFTTTIPTFADAQQTVLSPEQRAVHQSQLALVQQMLASPETLGPAQLAQMKERAKDTAMAFSRQMGDVADQRAAGRGLSTAGGGRLGTQLDIDDTTMQNLLGEYRDVDLEAAKVNRQNVLDALSGSSALMDAIGGQKSQAFRDALTEAMAGLEREGMQAEQGWRGYQSMSQADQNALQMATLQSGLAESGADRDVNVWDSFNRNLLDRYRAESGLYGTNLDFISGQQSRALQELLGRMGIGVDQQRIAEQARQFDRGFGLDFLRFLEGRDQFGRSLNQQWDIFANTQAGLGANSFFDNLDRWLPRG